jgi:hypothetical protein
VDAHPTACTACGLILRSRFTWLTNTVIPRSLKDPVCEFPHCLIHNSSMPRVSRPNLSAQNRLLLPSNMLTMSSSLICCKKKKEPHQGHSTKHIVIPGRLPNVDHRGRHATHHFLTCIAASAKHWLHNNIRNAGSSEHWLHNHTLDKFVTNVRNSRTTIAPPPRPCASLLPHCTSTTIHTVHLTTMRYTTSHTIRYAIFSNNAEPCIPKQYPTLHSTTMRYHYQSFTKIHCSLKAWTRLP